MNREEALRALVKQWRDEALALLERGVDWANAKADGVEDCADELGAILDASPWIPVTERLPEGVDIVWGQWGTRVAVGLCVDGEWERSERGEMLPCAPPDYWQRYEVPELCREAP